MIMDGISPQRWLRLTVLSAFKGKGEPETVDEVPNDLTPDDATLNKSTKDDYDEYGMW